MHEQNVYRYNYAFLYQSIAVYATTFVAYIVIRGLLIDKEFGIVFRDPVIYLLSGIIILSVLALLYNVYLRRRIIITSDKITLHSALRETEIDKSNVRAIRRSTEYSRGLLKTPVISFRLKDRKRPVRIRTYNFEQNEKLYAAIQEWTSELQNEHRQRRKK